MLFGVAAQAETLRIATFNAELTRKGPGLLLRDILKGEDPQIAAFTALLLEVRPDVIALQGIDHDLRAAALDALADALAAQGLSYPHRFTATPNAGQASGLDLNGNGTLGDADDAHGYGRFNGMGGMAVLSRLEVLRDDVEDYTPLLWRDLPGHIYPVDADGTPFGGAAVFDVHRLSSRGHWVVPLRTAEDDILRLMTFSATPPLYDGEEDRNGRRNHDETAFWLDYLARDASAQPFVIAGTVNTDPARGVGRREAVNALLAHPRLQNPFGATPTAVFSEEMPEGLQVDYLLPSSDWKVIAKGIETRREASRHSLLWMDIARSDP